MNSRIIVISTGGTIEKTYDEGDGSLENKKSIILQQIIKKLRLPYKDIEVIALMAKDSLFMTDNDRTLIGHLVQDKLKQNCPIVIIHGTDTMDVTAKYLYDTIKSPSQPIILTGAMRPIEFENSDAIQNVTEALYACRITAPGFYISFHSELFKVPQVRKNKEKGTFERYP
jgi:L-asparaginase